MVKTIIETNSATTHINRQRGSNDSLTNEKKIWNYFDFG